MVTSFAFIAGWVPVFRYTYFLNLFISIFYFVVFIIYLFIFLFASVNVTQSKQYWRVHDTHFPVHNTQK